MQAKDISDAAFLTAVQCTPGGWNPDSPQSWRIRDHVRATLEATMGPVPDKVFLAKARRLIRRGFLDGCDCGCRGDYHFPSASRGCC